MKPIQFYFQLSYRIKFSFLSINWYEKYNSQKLHTLDLSVHEYLPFGRNSCKNENYFSFLNLSHEFSDKVDWNFLSNGKLWNYNLQYFDYLQDEKLPLQIKLNLLRDFSRQLLDGKVRLESYPVSLRLINSLLFFSDHRISEEIIERAIKQQIHFLEKNLEYHILANHLLENGFALLFASYALRDKMLFKKAYGLVLHQLKEQTLPDGGHVECSPMYHSIILSRLLLSLDLINSNKFFDVEKGPLQEKAEAMLGWINAYSFSDGSWGLMNDAALGIAPSTQHLNEAAKKLDLHPKKTVLHESGYRKIGGFEWEALIDIGNIMPTYQPGHAHADMFSYCLWHKGKQVVVDPGISTYDLTPRRSWERGTSSHNTIAYKGMNQSDVWSSFRVGKRARCTLKNETDSEIVASHDGFMHKGYIHQRRFTWSRDAFEISDQLIGKSGKNDLFCSSFLVPENHPIDCTGFCGKVGSISLEFSHEPAVDADQYAAHYNELLPANRIKLHAEGQLTYRFRFS